MLKKGAQSFQNQIPIIPDEEIMNHDFEDFARRSRAGMAPLLTILIGMAGLMMIGCGVNSAPSTGSNAGAAPTPQPSHGGHAMASPTRRVPAHFSNVEDAMPFPAVLDPKQFSDPSIVKAYRYAQEIPEVFSQQPCYCYCDGGGGNEKAHRSLLDCFATYHGST